MGVKKRIDPIGYVPKKFRPFLQDCFYDSDGYFANFDDYVTNENLQCHCCHELTAREFRRSMKDLVFTADLIKKLGCDHPFSRVLAGHLADARSQKEEQGCLAQKMQ